MNEIKEWTWQDPLPLNPTLQQVFDKSLFSMRQQGRFSHKGVSCRYLLEPGVSCAIGLLIESDETKRKFDLEDLTGIESLQRDGKLTDELKYMNEPSMLTFLSIMQSCHDQACNDSNNFDTYELRMSKIAGQYGLVYAPTAPLAGETFN